jgi:twitching motility protein PilT
MRSGADILFIGEIRDDATAYEAVNASINGCLVVSTIHAGSPVQGVERILTYSRRINQNSAELLADGLSAVIHQKLHKEYRGEQVITRLRSATLDFTDCISGRAKLRAGNVDQLIHEVEEQANKKVWKNSGAQDAQ